METEKCSGCGSEIPEAETPFLSNDRIFCRDCYAFVIGHLPAPPAQSVALHRLGGQAGADIDAGRAKRHDAIGASRRARRLGEICVLLLVPLLVGLWVYAWRVSTRETAQKVKDFAPFVAHVDFSAALHNEDQFSGPVYVARPDGHPVATVWGQPGRIRDARTLAVCRTTQTLIGTYKYIGSENESFDAYRIVTEVCLIDLEKLSRRRVIKVISEPPTEIRNQKEYEEQSIVRIDDKLDPVRGQHNEQSLLARALRSAGVSTPP